jgi:hypothetical protein
MMARSRSGRGVALALALLAVGCGSLKRVRECELVIETVNSGLLDIQLRLPDAGSSAPDYELIADAYQELGKRLAELAPNDGPLQRALVSYAEVIERAEANSRAFAEELAAPARSKSARRSKDMRLKRIRAQAKSELAREAVAVRKLNTLCHP